MRRVYVLLPTEESCRAVVEELEGAGIPPRHLHAIAGLTHELKDLPPANVWQRTELARRIEWGMGWGGAAGLLGGLLVMVFPPGGILLGGGALLAGALAGAGFGALIAALLGSQEHNHKLDSFQGAFASGQILLMVDVARQRVKEVKTTILKRHPEARIASLRSDPESQARPRAKNSDERQR